MELAISCTLSRLTLHNATSKQLYMCTLIRGCQLSGWMGVWGSGLELKCSIVKLSFLIKII